jgi:uncharacterized membrane protein
MLRTISAVLLVLAAGACSQDPPTHQLVRLDGDSVQIPTSSVNDGEVHFFTFEHDGKNVNFLVRADGNGVLHAHLDACYACYRYKRGFVVEGPHLVCIACRLEYAITDEVWDYIGACAPISIHSSVKGDQLEIGKSVLSRAARYF